ncbi:hypothetical protein D3C73_927560 [compost metagenome]
MLFQMRSVLLDQIFQRNVGTCRRQLCIACHHIGIILARDHNSQLLVNVTRQEFKIEAGACLILNLLVNFIVRCRLLSGFADEDTDVERFDFVTCIRSCRSLCRARLFRLGVILAVIIGVVVPAASGQCKAQR